MTQELNKDGLEAALLAYQKSEEVFTDALVELTIQAYLSHLKVTGFEGRIAEWRKAVINGGTISTMIRDADKIIKDLQAALAGGGHE